MARPRKDEPSLCRDKSSGRAYVALSGHRVYLGEWGTKFSQHEYRRVLNEWKAGGRQAPPSKPRRTKQPAPPAAADITFGPGNKLAKDNPHARKVAKLRSAMLRAVFRHRKHTRTKARSLR